MFLELLLLKIMNYFYEVETKYLFWAYIIISIQDDFKRNFVPIRSVEITWINRPSDT